MEQIKPDTIDGAEGDFGKAGLQYRTGEDPRHLQHKIVEPRETIPGSYLNMITSLVYALEAKDKYTSGHSRRVAAIAAAIAKELGLPKHRMDKIAITGLIHDIGKIGVRESVLNKPGKLTNDEYQHVISHCEIGERILHPIIKDEEILDMVRHHHEHYDGTGYPDGLSGRDIPLAFRASTVGEIYSQIESSLAMDNILSKNASILAMADAYDAMMSPRSYRAALSVEAAAEEVRKGTGSQFDPEVAAALLRITNSLTPLFQEAQNRTGKEAERLAKEKTKRETEEAKKDTEVEIQAKKEPERLAKEETKREAEEAKKDTEVEIQAKKEPERLAKEETKREAEEAKQAREVEIQAKKEPERLAKEETKREAEEAKQAREVEIETKKEATHDIGAKIYEGNVMLVVPPPVGFEQVSQFKEYLERVENLRILFFGASADEGFIIAVSVQQPMTLIRILNEMPMVEKAIKKSKKQIVLMLKDTAAH
jgi:putative nucleotidyltransferase with HDIG domain